MTEPSRPHPVPGPPRPGPGSVPAAVPARPADAVDRAAGGHTADDDAGSRFADLVQRPVSEHVAVFEAEHDRLTRELGTIDQL
ncbi:hypothetical protein SAMN06273567_11769 [Geodermatophilus aquaeductus]|jgi:hypothetical protein|uniref:Uncharacterized protein n=1 Tax=Geodermatophilus aquaeductus TaxID=1564161 RepID=A0A521FTY6_9ACTN|nr:hypothetical protein [Geodermatophilus aquaeductus]SMO99606.1 hypothetical protein SAMN06273567_11769 [Geodermatophilus aquaeductus]